MSCSSCGCNPCTHVSCDASNEPLASALNNFITAFFGTLTKTCVNDQVVWNLPCDLDTGIPDFPRLSGEGLACYFLRFIQANVPLNIYGSFYALMPPDNPSNIPPGSPVAFPRDGPNNGIPRLSSSEFYLPSVGVYKVEWHVGINRVLGTPGGDGQVCFKLNGVELYNTVDKANNGILLETTVPNSILQLVNPSNNLSSIFVLSTADLHDTNPPSAWIVIQKK